MQILWGLIGTAIGVLILKKTYFLTNFLGRFDWAERAFSGGLGGTYFMYKIAGLLIIIFSVLYMFGMAPLVFYPFRAIFGAFR